MTHRHIPRMHHLYRTLSGMLLSIVFQMGCSADFAAGAVSTTTSEEAGGATSYRLVADDLGEASASHPSNPAPLKLLGRGTQSRIVNAKGEVLKAADADGAIYGLELSPNRRFALIYYGSAKYSVSPSDDLSSSLSLPKVPPQRSDATGFAWHWLDDGHLLGNSDLPSTDTEGRTASEIDSLPPRESLLYVYRLVDEKLAPVQIDEALPEAFWVYQTTGWNIVLLSADDEMIGARLEKQSDP